MQQGWRCFEISSEEILVLTSCTHHVVGTLSVLSGTAEALLPRLEEVTQIHLATGIAFRSQIQLQLSARWNLGGKSEEPQGIESPEGGQVFTGVYRCLTDVLDEKIFKSKPSPLINIFRYRY